MTNAEIISNAQFALMDAGKIGSTGRTLEVRDEAGNIFTMPEPEPIHTFNYWKEIGYSVRKGEKAVTKLCIWKYTSKRKTDEDGNEQEPESRMFMKTSAFFALSQVQPITANS